MKQTLKKLLALLCNVYMVILLVVLPLYTGGSYYLLGDRKYLLFRNVTGIMLVIFIIVTCVLLVVNREEPLPQLSLVDKCMLAYGGCAFLSAAFSKYQITAWLGYRDWYMGAVSQLLFVGIYFFVSRCYDTNKAVLYLGEAALFLVLLLAYLQRLDVDLLRLHKPFRENDWEVSHMLSTLGNINWFCSYLSVLLPLPLTGFLYARTKVKGRLLYLLSIFGLAMLWIQGSDIGLAVVFVILGMCFWKGVRKHHFFARGILLAAGMSGLLWGFGILAKLRNAKAFMPADAVAYEMVFGRGWGMAALLLLLLYFFFVGKPTLQKPIMKGFVLPLFVLVALGVLYGVVKVIPAMDYGNGRGMLWQLAIKGFREASFLQKWIGAGPDCYAHVLETTSVIKEGHWQGVVFANAHNEWLNQLVNLGIVGTGCYLGIFINSFKRYKGLLLGIMTLFTYVICSLVGFQQVMNAPYLFLILGLCENRLRKEERVI